MFLGKYRQREEEIVEMYWLVCGMLALVCPVILGLSGERKRAWQGFAITIVLAVIADLASAPMVFR